MKKSLVIAILLSSFGNLAALPLQSNDGIESIRQHYANINQNVGRYRRVKKELWGFSAEGGELVAYLHGPSVMKMAPATITTIPSTRIGVAPLGAEPPGPLGAAAAGAAVEPGGVPVGPGSSGGCWAVGPGGSTGWVTANLLSTPPRVHSYHVVCHR